MKKAIIIILSILFILVAVQNAFAKGSVELTVGYIGVKGGWLDYNGEDSWYDSDFSDKGFKIELGRNYYLTDKLSLAGKIGLEIISGTTYFSEMDNTKSSGEYDYKATIFNLSLFGRRDVVNLGVVNVGVQLGVINSTFSQGWNSNSNNLTFLVIGTYGEADLESTAKVYADLKFPIGIWGENHLFANYNIFSASFRYGNASFFEVFLYDITLGLTYKISSKTYLGMEGNISNVNKDGVSMAFEKKYDKDGNRGDDESSYFKFSIGAKLGYSF